MELARPLVVFEPLRVGYPWASDRLHAFVLQGMADNARAFARTPAALLPLRRGDARRGQRPARGARRERRRRRHRRRAGVLPAADDRRGRRRASTCALEAVDGNGLHPLRAVDRVFPTAFSYRAHLQKTLRRHLDDVPPAESAGRRPPAAGARAGRRCWARWPAAPPALLTGAADALASLPIDHDVAPVAARGGAEAGQARLDGVRRSRPRPPTPTTATIRTIRGPAACRPTCTSATCRRTRCSPR